MSQYNFGNLSSPVTGEDFINDHIEPWRDALHTQHSGTSTPSYAVPGTLWLDTTTTPWILNMFDGTDDIPLGTINATTNKFTPANIPTQWGGSAGGAANVLTLTPSPALAAAPAAGAAYDFLVTATNTTQDPTINVSGQGAVTIKGMIGSGKAALAIGALQNGMIARIVHDGTHFILLNQRPYNPAADIATASSVNLDAATGDYVKLTGTTTINTITLGNGQERVCKADSAFTLTNSSDLICPKAANIAVAAGDVFVVRGEAGSAVRIVGYTRANGLPLAFLDEDDMTSNSAVDVPSQQSVKAYIDAKDQIIYARDEKSTGTDGGGSTANSWVTRTLNTVVTNTISGASLSSNTITLPAGTYDVWGRTPSYGTLGNQCRLYNVTDGAEALLGFSSYSNDREQASEVHGRITLAAQKDVRLEMNANSSVATGGLGFASDSGSTEIYSELHIRRII